MRIGFDISPLTPNRTGVGTYCYFLLRALLANHGQHSFFGYSTGSNPVVPGPSLASLAGHRHWRVPTRVAYKLWDVTGHPKVDSAFGGLDVFHATNFFLPPVTQAARVVTIHDLGFLVNPSWSSPKIVGPYSKGIERFVREADAILVYSESTRNDLVRLAGAVPEKIHLAPLGVDARFRPMSGDLARKRVTERYGLAFPYLFFVSTIEPRKNIEGMIRAYAKAAKHIPHRLVLAGGMGWQPTSVEAIARDAGVADRVVTLGYVKNDEDLPALYSAADVFLFPSHYEGFGLPILEAFACGCPVVTSNRASLPEVAGDAALMSDSEDLDEIAKNIIRIIGDDHLREGLIHRGRERARTFTWQRCAAQTMQTYEAVAHARSV